MRHQLTNRFERSSVGGHGLAMDQWEEILGLDRRRIDWVQFANLYAVG